MLRIAMRLSVCAFALGLMASAGAQEPRTAKVILDEIKAIKPPTNMQEFRSGMTKKADLIAELAKVDPENKELTLLLPQRWIALLNLDKSDEAMTEIDATLAKTKDDTLKKDGLFYKAILMARSEKPGADAVADEFIKLAPKDPRVPNLLNMIASSMDDSNPKKAEIEDRILKDFATSQVARMVKAERDKAALYKDKIGKPFELEFDEAIKGTHMSMKDLKGKVVVIDFWATWCGPCVAEMPTMKKLYAEYKDKGVEFIGVSLDQSKDKGGLDALKKFVADNGVTWPQYYQGNWWQSDFSKGWGINSIPAVFIVDADGNLYSVKARGKLADAHPRAAQEGQDQPRRRRPLIGPR